MGHRSRTVICLNSFKEAARELETDDDSERFKDRLGKIVKAKPKPEKPE